MLLKRKDLKFVNLISKKSILQNYETYNLAITKVLSITRKDLLITKKKIANHVIFHYIGLSIVNSIGANFV